MGTSWKLGLFAVCLTAAANGATEKLAGVVEYKGGFAKDLTVKTSPGEFVKYFRVAVPTFCKTVDVLEAATMTSGQKDPAKLNDKGSLTFEVNEGSGQRIDAIQLTLNGPSDAACTIPVYLSDEPTVEPDPDPLPGPSSDITLCNRTNVRVYGALGWQVDGRYVSQGWYVVEPRGCMKPALKSAVKGPALFVYGQTGDGFTQWGKGPSFCVGTSTFYSTGTECQAFQPGFFWRAFSQHAITPGKGLTVYYQ